MDTATILLIAYCWTILVNVEANQCVAEEIDACEANRDDYLKRTGYNETEFYLTHVTEDQLRTSCSYFATEIKQCFEDLSQYCIEEIQATFKGYINAMEYLCGEELEDFISFKPCILEPDAQISLTICRNQYLEAKENIVWASNSAYLKYCQAKIELTDCEEEALRVSCGSLAGEYVRTYNTYLYAHTIEYFCPSTNQPTSFTTQPTGTMNTSTVAPTGIKTWIYAVIGAGGTLLVVIIIVTIVCSYRKCSSTRNDGLTMQQKLEINRQLSTQSVDNQHKKAFSNQGGGRKHHKRHPHQAISHSHHSDRGYGHHREDERIMRDSRPHPHHHRHHQSNRPQHNFDDANMNRGRRDRNRNRPSESSSNQDFDMLDSEYLHPATNPYTPTPNASAFTSRAPSLNELEHSGSFIGQVQTVSGSVAFENAEYTQLTKNTESHYEELPI